MLRNLIHRLHYRICDLWLDFKTGILHLGQRKCKHKYKFVRRIQYDAETGYSIVQRVCFVEDANGDSYYVDFDETNQGFIQTKTGMRSQVKPLIPIEPMTFNVKIRKEKPA